MNADGKVNFEVGMKYVPILSEWKNIIWENVKRNLNKLLAYFYVGYKW